MRALEFKGARAYAISMGFIHLLSMVVMLGSDVLAEPAYPPNTISGGTVVAELRPISGGAAQVRILSGEEPFVSSSKTALQKWNLPSEKGGPNLVVVHFRQANLYYVGSAEEEINCAGVAQSLPCPRKIVRPSYPAQSLGQGSVVLQVDVGEDGGILNIRTLKGIGALAEISVEAVRQWKFSPAEDVRGLKTASRAYAVFVYRTPVIEQRK
jgi:TonB family protein